MIDDLSKTLQAIINASVKNVDVAFDRPAESYSPSSRTINLFLYDLRENAELRENEPVITRMSGTATITRPPLRLSCSYLVSVWIESGLGGEQSVLEMHRLLGEVLRIFSGMTVIEEKYLQGELLNSLYQVSLVAAQVDQVRNPSEFWTAIGGKLRPSFTITAVIPIVRYVEPVKVSLVSSVQVNLGEKSPETSEFSNPADVEQLYEIGGIVSDISTGAVLDNVEMTIMESGKQAMTDSSGRYQFSSLKKGSYKVRIVKKGYPENSEYELNVPGLTPTAFDLKLIAT